jgi:hypothetical protein
MDVVKQDVGKEWQEYLDGQKNIAKEQYRDTLVENGMPKEQADQIAEVHPPAKLIEDPAILKAREEYRDTILSTGWAKTREQADRLAGIGIPLQDEPEVG